MLINDNDMKVCIPLRVVSTYSTHEDCETKPITIWRTENIAQSEQVEVIFVWFTLTPKGILLFTIWLD